MPADASQADNPKTSARAFWVTGPGEGEIRTVPVQGTAHTETPELMAEVETLYSGISRGTEALVFSNQVPESEAQRMRAPFQQGEFPYPVKYGYSNVGRVVRGPEELVGKTVFCLFPHQSRYRVPVSALLPLPEEVPASRAILAANMETAINGLWDGQPRVGDRIAVIGLGVVGLLVAWLASRIPGTRVTAVDINPARADVAKALGLHFQSYCHQDDHDLVFHASGHAAGLETALSIAGMEGRIIEMSWYGRQTVPLSLGQGFHARRLTIRSSQVGHLNPAQQPRWSHSERLSLALSLLQDNRLDALVSGESPFEDLPDTMTMLSGRAGSEALCHRIVYPQA